MSIEDIDFDRIVRLADGTKKRFGDWTRTDFEQASAYVSETISMTDAVVKVREAAIELLNEAKCANLDAVIRAGGDSAAKARALVARGTSLEAQLDKRIDVGRP